MADEPADALTAPLAAFSGARPRAPAWFERALADGPEVLRVDVDGAGVEVLAWGRRGRPGLLLMHGAAAHAGWWRHIAPLLAQDFRVAALSFSGMGGSDWRDGYSLETYVAEARAAADAAGLGPRPLVAAHSFGGRVAARWAAMDGAGLAAAVIIDSLMRPPGVARAAPPFGQRPHKVYPTLEAALARFRLAPLQPCENLFLVDAVAREGIGPGPGGQGWTWRFDPELFGKLEDAGRVTADDLAAAACPVALIIGDRSKVAPPDWVAQAMLRLGDPPLVRIPDAEHHIMLDQPMALVAGLRGLLAAWPGRRA